LLNGKKSVLIILRFNTLFACGKKIPDFGEKISGFLDKITDFWEKIPDLWKKNSLTFGNKQNPSLFFRTIHCFYLGRIREFRGKIPIIRVKLPNSYNPKMKNKKKIKNPCDSLFPNYHTFCTFVMFRSLLS